MQEFGLIIVKQEFDLYKFGRQENGLNLKYVRGIQLNKSLRCQIYFCNEVINSPHDIIGFLQRCINSNGHYYFITRSQPYLSHILSMLDQYSQCLSKTNANAYILGKMLTMEFLIVEGKKLDSNKYKTNGNRQLIESWTKM